MTDLSNDFSTHCAESLIAGGAVGVVLALEHVGMWPITRHLNPANELTPLLPYVVGTATIGLGITALAMRWRDPRMAIAYWTIAGVGGAVVGGLRLYRRWLSLIAADSELAGHGAGLIDGTRRSWDVIERGSRSH